MKLSKKSQSGSALLTVLLLITVITTTIGTLVGVWHLQRKLVLQKSDFLQARYNAESALELTLTGWKNRPAKVNIQQPEIHTRYLPAGDSVLVSTYSWGLFQKAQIVAIKKRQRYSLTRLCAPVAQSPFDKALILSPHYSELVVCGDTRIQGPVQVGLGGVKSALMNGRPYTGDRLIYGPISKDAIDIRPQANTLLLDSLFSEFDALCLETHHPDLPNFGGGDTLDFSSFEGGYLPIFSIDQEDVGNRQLTIIGPVILIGQGSLSLEYQLVLNQVQVLCQGPLTLKNDIVSNQSLFYAKNGITLADVNESDAQFLSAGKISLHNSHLGFPSVILSYAEDEQGGIDFRNSTIKGAAFSLTRKPPPRSTGEGTLLRIGKNAQVNGLAFSDRRIELAGKVLGTVITERFHFYDSPHDWYNRVWNGEIAPLPDQEKILKTVILNETGNRWAPIGHRWPKLRQLETTLNDYQP